MCWIFLQMKKNIITELFLPNTVLSYTTLLRPSWVANILSLHSMTLGNGTANTRLPEKPHEFRWLSAFNTLRICSSQVTGTFDNQCFAWVWNPLWVPTFHKKLPLWITSLLINFQRYCTFKIIVKYVTDIIVRVSKWLETTSSFLSLLRRFLPQSFSLLMHLHHGHWEEFV